LIIVDDKNNFWNETEKAEEKVEEKNKEKPVAEENNE